MENKIDQQQETPLNETPTGNEEVKTPVSLESQLAEINDKYLRLYSDFDNFKKRTQKEKMDFFKFAGEEVISSILPVLDDFDRALKANTSTDKAFADGIILIQNKLLSILKQKGVEEIITEKAEFNTDVHEAITNIPAPTDDLKGKVVDCVEKGYYLHGKVIRFAKVVVGA